MEKNNEKLSVVKQCKLLGLNRSTLYYKAKPINKTEEYQIKWLIDRLYTDHPNFGYRTMTTVLKRDFGISINKKRTRRYMRDMAIHGLCPGPNLSKREHAKYLYPYLLRKLHINRPNQVWSIDITYLRMPKGHMYLCAIIDWHSRFIVSYELSTTMDKAFVLSTVQKAIQAHGKPEIINSDQGSQFTCEAYIELLKENDIKISMDDRGKALDNIRIERFWRTLKWEKTYIEEYSTPKQLRKIVNEYMQYYNYSRPHQSLDGRTPGEIYNKTQVQKLVA